MKITKLYATLISLTFSLNAFAIGLGDMTVLSSLNQSFDAEIALIDVGDIPLSNIKANLASVEDYDRAGLERSFDMNTLTFVIERNRHGRVVIHLRSMERMSDPFLQLLIDLAWAKGQLFREYDVLLDPPDYQLVSKIQTQINTHKIKHKPSIAQVEREGAQEEGADEKTSPSKQPILREVTQPYESPSEVALESKLPSAPVIARPGQLSKQYLSASQDSLNPMQPDASHLEGVGTALKAQMDVTAQAIDSLRESNALLKEQLHSMHDQNQALQGQLKQRDAEMKHMHKQIELLMSRQGAAGQVIQPHDNTEQSVWLWVFILLAAAAGGSYIAWRKWGFPDVDKAYQFVQSRMKTKVKAQEDAVEAATVETVETVETSKAASEPPPPPPPPVEIEASMKEDAVEPMPNLVDSTAADVNPVVDIIEVSPKQSTIEDVPTHNLIEFEGSSSSAEQSPPPVDESLIPVRSLAALDTLLALTQTYIEMGDTAAAHESLKEVLEFGNKKQQAAAKKLMKLLSRPN